MHFKTTSGEGDSPQMAEKQDNPRKQITETIPKILKRNKDRPAAFLIAASKTELKTAALEPLLLRETKQT